MYTATITEKKILEQHEYVLLTVVLVSDKPIEIPKDKEGKEMKRFVMEEGGKPKLDKDGKPKVKPKDRVKYPSKTIYFKFKIDTPFVDMKAEIKKRIDSIEAIESEEIPMNTPLIFTEREIPIEEPPIQPKK